MPADPPTPTPPAAPPRGPAGRLLIPALRWDGAAWRTEGGDLDELLALGVSGFILFGGTRGAAAELVSELKARAGRPLLFASDLERGAGQQFEGLPGLPPLAALAAIEDDADRVRALATAARETARGARAAGVGLVFAPVADLAVEPENPIVGTRAAGADPERVAEAVAVWVRACLAEGVACAVKHWPGHGRTTVDSHAELPVVDAPAEVLAADRRPFEAGIEAGVPVVMTAHVAFPALDPSGRPATRSAPILSALRALGFEGAIVTDALIMEAAGDAGATAREILGAGVDLFLYPADALGTAAALAGGDPARLQEAAGRVDGLVAGFADAPGPPGRSVADVDPAAAAALCDLVLSGDPVDFGGTPPGWVRVRVFDDDLGGRYPPPSREPFTRSLLELGVPVGDGDSQVASERADCLALLAVFGEPRAWKGRAGLAPATATALADAASAARRRGETVRVVCFGGPRIRDDVRRALDGGTDAPDAPIPILLAWGGEAPMQRAAARRIARLLRPAPGA